MAFKSIDNKVKAQSENPVTKEVFEQFIKHVVKSEVKLVFEGLSEEGVQAGKKDIDRSIRKITKKVVIGDKGRYRMGEGEIGKIKAYVKSYLIHKFVHHKR